MRADGVIALQQGLFYGFHADTWAVILIQACGGLLTGVVIKYAGNILKGFANALAILTTSFISIPLFNYHPDSRFWAAVVCVCAASVMYGAPPSSRVCRRSHEKVLSEEHFDGNASRHSSTEMAAAQEDIPIGGLK